MRGRVHFVGMGGVGMSALARILLSMGVEVSGSDIQRNGLLDELEGLGAQVFIGHKASQVGDASLVVYSTAIKDGNPEIIEARERDIPVIHRGEMLAMIMDEKDGVAVAGSHGKTTTTSLVSAIFVEARWHPTIIVGGRISAMQTNALLGSGRLIVAEADESDGSFLKLSPRYAIVTNIDREHLDHYGDFSSLVAGFRGFLDRVKDLAAVCWDDPVIRGMKGEKMITYGFSPGVLYRACDVKKRDGFQSFTCMRADGELGLVKIRLFGDHNVLNSLGALALALEMGVEWDAVTQALAAFSGVERRLTCRGEIGGITVVDDYGHHPTEIACAIQAARERWPGRRLVVVFQPHRYSRTKALMKEFWDAFHGVDELLVMDVYRAGEVPNGVTGMDVWRGVKEKSCPQAFYLPHKDEVVEYLVCSLKCGDLLLTLGAGDVWKVGLELLEHLEIV